MVASFSISILSAMHFKIHQKKTLLDSYHISVLLLSLFVFFGCAGTGGRSDPVVRLSCSTPSIPCVFRASTVEQCLATSPCCPACNFRFEIPGPQPSGTMECHLDAHTRCDTGEEPSGDGSVMGGVILYFCFTVLFLSRGRCWICMRLNASFRLFLPAVFCIM